MNTRERLLEAAEHLMLRRGYTATRVDEIIAQAGVTKGSFYHFFASKEALALDALDRYYAGRVGALAQGDYAAIEDPAERARGFLQHLRDLAPWLWSDGCLLAGFTVDGRDSSPAIAARVEEHLAELTGVLESVLAPLAGNGSSPRTLAEDLLVCIEGGIMLSRARSDTRYLEDALDRHLRGLID